MGQLCGADVFEEIRLLLGIDLSSRLTFSLILAGNDYLLGALKLRSHRALYTRIACHYHLEPWTPEQLTQLLEVSHQAIGLNHSRLDTGAQDLIISASNGLPRTALQIAQAAWIKASQDKSRLSTCKASSAPSLR